MKRIYKAGSFIGYLWEKLSALVKPNGNHTKVGDTTTINVINIGSKGNAPPNINVFNLGRVENITDSNYTGNNNNTHNNNNNKFLQNT